MSGMRVKYGRPKKGYDVIMKVKRMKLLVLMAKVKGTLKLVEEEKAKNATMRHYPIARNSGRRTRLCGKRSFI